MPEESGSLPGENGGMTRLADYLDDRYRGRGEIDLGKRGALDAGDVARVVGGCGADAEQSYRVQWRLARDRFVAGANQPSLYGAGTRNGLQAVRINPGGVEGQFWFGVNLALFAEARGGLRGALAILKARSALKRAALIDESYHGAGPLRVLGRLEHKAPWFLGGSRRRARHYFDRALAIEPNNSVTLVYAAELALAEGRRGRANELLEKVANSAIDPEWRFENERDKSQARTMLDRIRGS